MAKESKNAAQRRVVVLDGMRYKKAVTKPEMAMASANDRPRDPVGMLSKFKFIAYPLDGGDVFLPNLFAHFADMYVHRAGKHKDIRSPDIVEELVTAIDDIGIAG